jgi:hypothetical protein
MVTYKLPECVPTATLTALMLAVFVVSVGYGVLLPLLVIRKIGIGPSEKGVLSRKSTDIDQAWRGGNS